MPLFTISKTSKFEAAHRLRDHDGKCRSLHGHSYTINVILKSKFLIPSGSKKGMILDFEDLGVIINNEIIKPCDHRFLADMNDSLVKSLSVDDYIILPIERTTAELLADHFSSLLMLKLRSSVEYIEVVVYETITSFASCIKKIDIQKRG